MELNLMAFAIPFFIFFIFLEYYYASKSNKNLHTFEESITNLNIGIAERLTNTFVAGGFYYFYDTLYDNFSIFKIESSLVNWILLLVVTDFIWYWYHRFGHEINLFWGFHVVHHSSEDFNFTVATRVTIFQAFLRTMFWSVLPILGFSAAMITSILIIHGLYPFFTHTRMIGKLGILEYLLVTPSHHRVHHASNEEYLDKNYGDIFIVWDRIFGTFKEEGNPIVYGLTNNIRSKNFFWQHFHFLIELLYVTYHKEGLKNKLKILFGSPKKFISNTELNFERLLVGNDIGRFINLPCRNYIKSQMVITLFVLFVFILFENYIELFHKVILSSLILVTITLVGGLLEQKRWVIKLEYIRFSLFFSLFIDLKYFLYYLFLMLLFVLFFSKFFNKKMVTKYFSNFYESNIE